MSARTRAVRLQGAYMLAYLRYLAGERDTLPAPAYWRMTEASAAAARARVDDLVAKYAAHEEIADAWIAQRLAGIEPAAEEEPERIRPLRRARRARR